LSQSKFVCFSYQMAVAAMVPGRAASLGKLHQVALINRPLGRARNLAVGSRLLQLPVSHVHVRRRALSYLAGPEQERL
jgi:hypothetical protein